ncbi:MAG: hypothetical protein PHN78_03660 [Dehalococcoidales bacterium]|nr:hypothetical protein [Dehalococcoidales bacterium]
MIKLKKPISKELPPVKLYLDDLKAICDTLAQKAKTIDISVDTGIEEYKVEDIEQLKKLETKKIHELSIKCSDPYITIEFKPGWVKIYFGEDSTYNRGILSEIEDILQRRKVFGGRFLTSFWASFLVGGLIGGSFIGMLVTSKTYVWLFLALELISILLMTFLWKFTFSGYSTIVLSESKEEISFWKRNRDQILVALIAATVGSLVTVLVLWIVKLL